MATQEMRIKIGADVSQGVAGIKSFSSSLGTIPPAADKAKDSLNNLVPEGSIQEARLTVKRLKAEIASLSTEQLKSPFGKFLTDDLKSATKELKKMEQQAGLTANNIANPIAKNFGLLRTLANILPGIGIAGIIGGAATLVEELVTEFTKVSDVAKEAGKDIEASFASASGKAAGEVSELKSLISIAQNETLSRKARQQAIDKLNQEYDKYLPKLTLENIKTQETNNAVNKLTDSLIRQAKIKGLQDLISKETQKQAELLVNDLEDNATIVDKISAALSSLKSPGSFSLELQAKGAERTAKEIDKSSQKLSIFNKLLVDLNTQEAKNGTLFTEDSKAQIDALTKQLSLLEKIRDVNLERLGKLFDASDIEQSVTALAKLEGKIGDLKLQIALRDAEKAKLPAEEIRLLKDSITADTQKKLKELFDKEALLLEAKAKIKVTQVTRVEVPDVNSAVAKATGLDSKIPEITIPEARIKILGFERGTFVNDISKQIEKLEEDLKRIPFELKLNLKIEGLSNLSESLGNTLADALNGESIGASLIKAAQSFLQGFGNVLTQIGKEVIEKTLLIKALKKALSSVFANPAASIGIGIALVAAGTLLKNIKLPGFADGGVAKGPKSGFPVILHGEELIVPMNKVNRINTNSLNGVGQSIQFAPIAINIPGQMLQILLDRVNRSNGRLV